MFARILIKDGQPKFKVRPEGGRGLFEQHEPQHGGARIPGQEGLQRGLIRNGRQGMQSVGKGPFSVNFEPFLGFFKSELKFRFFDANLYPEIFLQLLTTPRFLIKLMNCRN